MMNMLVWILLALLLVELAHSWLFRRRLKRQHQTLATLYSEVAKNRERDAAKWRARMRDPSLPPDERDRAYGHAVAATGNAYAYADVAADIEHVLVNGKSIQSRMVAMNEEIARLERDAENTIICTSKGGVA